MVRIRINPAFHGQRVTGQQRYATEISSELLSKPGVSFGRQHAAVARSAVSAWAWSQLLPFSTQHDEWTLSLTSRAPVVGPRKAYTVHDLFPITNPEWYSNAYVATHAPLLRAHIRSADILVAVSEVTADRIRQLFGYSRPIVIAPNAPSSKFLRSAAPPESIRIGDFNAHPNEFLLTVGSADPRKNHARLERAYRQLPMSLRRDLPLVIAGGNSRHFSATGLMRSTEGLIHLGYVSDDELSVLYRSARGVVYPSLDEGFGLPAVEALASGARLAVSDIAIFHETLGDADAIFFDPNAEDSIANALLQLANALEERNPPSAPRYSWARSAAVIYDQLIG